MRYSFIVLVILLAAGCNNTNEKKAEENTSAVIDGEQLFKNNCVSCHMCDKEFTGPPLNGSLERWGNDKELMYEFIRDPYSMFQKNKYARDLQRRYNMMQMTAFQLTNKELDAIFNYCSSRPGVVR